jgi:hypothetical protein
MQSPLALKRCHLVELADRIGPQSVGSPGNRAVAAFIEAHFAAAGLAVERQPFGCVAWEASEVRLEKYGLGGDRYLQARGLAVVPFGETPMPQPSALDELVAMLNINGVGQVLGTTLLGALACSPAVEQLVDAVAAAHPGVVVRDRGPASNHYDFYIHGVPSIVLSSLGLGNLIHLPHDTPAGRASPSSGKWLLSPSI